MMYQQELTDIFHVPRILGTFPFDGRFRLRKKLLAYCCLVRLVVVLSLVDCYRHPSPHYIMANETSISLILLCILAISVVGDIFFTIFWWVGKRDTVAILMENLDQIQRKCKPTGVRRFRLSYCHLFALSGIHIFSYYVSCDGEHTWQYARNEIGEFLGSFPTVGFITQFWDLLRLMRVLFLESTQFYDESSVVNYERFSRLSGMVNDVYEPQVLFTMTKYFLLVLLQLYMLLQQKGPRIISRSSLTSIVVAIGITIIVLIIIACSNYTNEEKNFNEELRRRMVEEKSQMLAKNDKVKLHFLVRQETVFTACGYFNIDRSLICSMISAATTYLVLLLQYGNEESSEMASTAAPAETLSVHPSETTVF